CRARCEHAVAERLEATLKVGQWRAQLMRGVDDELAPHLLLLLQALRHLVERVGERRHFLRALALHPCLVLAMGNAPGCAGDLVEWSRQPQREERGQQDA